MTLYGHPGEREVNVPHRMHSVSPFTNQLQFPIPLAKCRRGRFRHNAQRRARGSAGLRAMTTISRARDILQVPRQWHVQLCLLEDAVPGLEAVNVQISIREPVELVPINNDHRTAGRSNSLRSVRWRTAKVRGRRYRTVLRRQGELKLKLMGRMYRRVQVRVGDVQDSVLDERKPGVLPHARLNTSHLNFIPRSC